MENILKCLDIAGTPCKKFDNDKKYIATGDVLENKIANFEIVNYENKPSRANLICEEGDIIFAKMKDTVKVLEITKENQNNIYSTGFLCVKPKKEYYNRYIYWLINSKKFNEQKNKLSKGATQKAINNENFKKINIKIENDYAKQKLIAKKIDLIHKIIIDKTEQLKKLDEIVKSQFVENLFVNGLEVA